MRTYQQNRANERIVNRNRFRSMENLMEKFVVRFARFLRYTKLS